MKLEEAVKSGRKFKRPFEDSYWTLVEKDGLQWLGYADGKMEPLCIDYLLAEDWELEPEQEVALTKTQILQAIRDSVKEKFAEKKIQFYNGTDTMVTQCILEAAAPIVKKLGFK